MKWRKAWRIIMSCDVGEVSKSLENELSHFTYITAHSPTLPSLYLHHNSFSNLSIASPTSQLILQPFFCLSYVTGFSLTSPGEPPMELQGPLYTMNDFILHFLRTCSMALSHLWHWPVHITCKNFSPYYKYFPRNNNNNNNLQSLNLHFISITLKLAKIGLSRSSTECW